MREVLRIVGYCALALQTFTTHAQCDGGRFRDEIFASVSVDSVTYSSPYSLKMDIYQPVGDAMAHRPLIILAHEGAFISGNRSDDATVDSLCMRFARRGYVTASIDYRLTTMLAMLSPDSSLSINAVIKAVSDAKAAIRYFVRDAVTTDTWKIDTNNIYTGGNSAGAVLNMHLGYITSSAECPPYVASAFAANGGIDGNSSDPVTATYGIHYRAIIDMAGALNKTSFINTGDVPSVNFQGDLDNVVPYTCAKALGGLSSISLCGMGPLEPALTAAGIFHSTTVFPGAGHVPWDSDPVMFKTVDSTITEFLYTFVCSGTSSVQTLAAATASLYPNPTLGDVTITTTADMSMLEVADLQGRIVLRQAANGQTEKLHTESLSPGLYILTITLRDGSAPVTKRLIVER
ncbi:MAG: T9SS type A sorting domain-containing protein [Taibaiella sp.]|nr:T9SS type A sorting domain-containing protein [Taibaiella sp.]